MHKRIQFPAPPKDNYEGWELNLKNTSISRNRVSTVFFWLEGLGYKEKEAFMGLYLNIVFLSLSEMCILWLTLETPFVTVLLFQPNTSVG